MNSTELIGTSAEIAGAVTESSGGDLIASGLLLVIGLVLWSAGRMILRPATVILGLTIGGLTGWVATDQFDLGLSPWVSAFAAASVLGVLSLLMYRVAVMVALALLFAIVVPLSVVSVTQTQLEATPAPVNEQGLVEAETVDADEISAWLEEYFGIDQKEPEIEDVPTTSPDDTETLEGAMPAPVQDNSVGFSDKVAEWIARVLRASSEQWKRMPMPMKPTVIACAVIGAAGGLLIGLISSTFSVSVLTAVAGSIFALVGLRSLMIFFGVPEGPWHPSIDPTWLIVWLITSVAGLWIQWTSRPETADKPG